ncbi:AAA family ATPase [Candidatus Micrarchaeota archaeon]|nr:AAA family ATPase [Candidatus Micrarchaeota archaeon]
MGIVLGLTGENCAGKGTVAAYLEKKGFYYYSLSDVIREELAAEGAQVTRDNLIAKGNFLREKFGPAVLAEKTLLKLQDDRNYVIDSFRNPKEAEAFKKAKPNFFLLYITAPSDVRFERMKTRGRESDPKSFEAFKVIEEKERSSASGRHQNLDASRKLADRAIANEADFPALYDVVDRTLADLSKEFRVDRPSWDEYFMNIAKMAASRSNCIKRKVAAVIVRDKRIMSTGYNGTPRGTRNCNEGGCPRCNNFGKSGEGLEECLCSHAEENAIVQASYHGIPIANGTLYSTFSPCLLCAKMIINAGLKEVVYSSEYSVSETASKLLREAGVMVRKV